MSGEGFLSRWSRRKRAAEREPDPPAPEEAALALPPADAPPLPAEVLPSGQPPAEEPSAGEPIDLASLPSIEDLTAESDISAFLRPGVPAWLRTAALRRMWSLDPEIRSFVGPADYAWDYNAPDGVPGFSLELGGDVKRLLAQAIGLEEDGEKNDKPDTSPEPAVALAAAAEVPPPPGPDVPAGPPDEAAAVEPPADIASRPEPEGQDASPRRRHGGALPA
jgi:hypothetical protein